MKYPILFLLLFFLFACSLNESAKIIKNNTELHEGPNKESNILTRLHSGQNVTLLEIDSKEYNYDGTFTNYWKKIRLNDGTIGYVFGDYILTSKEEEIIKIADEYSIEASKEKAEFDYKQFEYDSIFLKNNEWEIIYISMAPHVVGSCNVVYIYFNEKTSTSSYKCFS